MHTTMVLKEKAFAPHGVLKPGFHDALFADLDKLASTAGLGGAKRYVFESCRPHLDQTEIDNAANMKIRVAEGILGTIYTGDVPRVADRFMALTGSFMRNYINARFMPLQSVLDEYRRFGTVEATVLLIPDFHVPMGEVPGKKLSFASSKASAAFSATKPQFVTESVASLLLERIGSGLFTYLYSEDPTRISADYGPYVEKLLMENYDVKASAGQPVA